LPTLVDNLEIELGSEESLPAAARALGAHEALERSVYLIKGDNCLGYVIAGTIAYTEDDGDYDSPSSLLDL
jgi:hypothetical protein